MGIGDLTEQDARGRHELLKGQGSADEQAGETQLTEHDAVEQASEDDRQTTEAALEQAQAQQAGEGKEAQLRGFS